MRVNRWEPFADVWGDVSRFRTEMGRLFRRLGVDENLWPSAFPPVNVWETDEAVFVEAELPGLKREQLELFVSEGNQLTLKGEFKHDLPEKGVWHRQERAPGKFQRVLTLPVAVDADKVEAAFDNGVLLVKLPRAEEAKPRRIDVKAQ